MPKLPGWTLVTSPAGIAAGVGITSGSRTALLRAGFALQAEWKRLLNTPGQGREYTTRFFTSNTSPRAVIPYGERPLHRASAVGDPPAPDTGALRNSIQVVGQGDKVLVGTNLRYGLALEYGVNVTGSQVGPHPAANYRLEPRPHARPALANALRDMTDGITASLQTSGKSGLGTRSLPK